MKRPAPADYDGLVALLIALGDNMTKLTGSVATLAERRGRQIASDISDGVSEAVHSVQRKGISAEAELEKTVATHPSMAMGLATGIGLLIGA